MKPVIIYIDKNKDELILTKEELEKIIDDAYNAGKQEQYVTITTPPVSPYFNQPYNYKEYNTTTCTTKS